MDELLQQRRFILEIRRALRRERIFRDRFDPLDIYSEQEFRDRYRFTKATFRHILEMINDGLDRKTRRNNPVPAHIQLLLALRYYATDNFQRVSGDLLGLHISTANRAVHRVSRLLASLRQQWIKFPMPDEFRQVKRQFFDIKEFPGVIGAIDGSHIRIANPGGEDSARFVNRKGFYSVNTQVICDASMKITNIVARWPGSTHDSRILENSRILDTLETLDTGTYILGDNGYACKKYLLTPLLRPGNPAENKYNQAHKATRGIIERLFGVMKRRFPSLHYGLRCKLDYSLTIIIAIAVLHNIAVHYNEPEFEDEMIDLALVDELLVNDRDGRGTGVRTAVIREYFSNQ